MNESTPSTAYLEPTQASGRDFVMRQIVGPIVMLNLLRFRDTADYSATPQLAPESPVSGAQAFDLYIRHTLPHLHQSGGKLLFLGDGGALLIGPAGERWDKVLLVQHQSSQTFLSFASNDAYLSGIGHRMAALEDSRLLPIMEGKLPEIRVKFASEGN